MDIPSRDQLAMSAKSGSSKAVGAGLVVVNLVWKGITKLGEHAILAWINDNLGEGISKMPFLHWAIERPFLLLMASGVAYCLFVVLLAKRSGEHENGIHNGRAPCSVLTDRHTEGAYSPSGDNSPVMNAQSGSNFFAPGGTINYHEPTTANFVDPRIQFTSSPLWTNDRKVIVRKEIQSFDKYLSGYGIIKAPDVLPMLTIVEGKQTASGFFFPATPPFDHRQIPMGTEALSPVVIRNRYANYVFDSLLSIYQIPGRLGLIHVSWIYSEYFAASSLNCEPTLDQKRLGGWVVALWELRQKQGQEFTDRALMWGIKAPVEYSDDWNRNLRKRLQQGVLVVKNDFEYFKVNEILERYGLLR